MLDVADSRATPEEQLLEGEEEKSRAGLLAVIKAAARELAPEERAKHKAEHEAKDETRQRT